jgi:hypothetical protein
VPDSDVRDRIRNAVYDLVWQTAHLYNDAPGGKLACSQRSRLARYVDGKMMNFDLMLQNEKDESGFAKAAEDFIESLEENFQSIAREDEGHFSFYQERKQVCLEIIWGSGDGRK